MFEYKNKIKKKKAFVVLSTQRSGSTLVCKDIAGAQVFGRPEEFFLSVMNNKGSEESIDTFFTKCQSENSDFFSVKLMCNYLKDFGRFVLGEDHPSLRVSDYQKAAIHFFKDNFEEVHFIYVRRHPPADQAFSRVIARTQGLWHVQSDGRKVIDVPYGDTVIEIESAGLLYTLFDFTARVESENTTLEFLFQDTSTECHVLDYKEIVQGYPNYILKLCTEFGLPCPGNLPERMLKKVITDKDNLGKLVEFKSIVGEDSIRDRCLSGNFEDFSPAQFLLASMFFRLYRDFKKAVSCGISSLDQGFEALLNLANVYFEIFKDYVTAEKYYKLAVSSPNFSHPHYRLSIIYDQQEKLNEAIEEINIAIDLYNGSPDYYHHLEQLLQKSGDVQGAKKAQERAAALVLAMSAPHVSCII